MLKAGFGDGAEYARAERRVMRMMDEECMLIDMSILIEAVLIDGVVILEY